MTNIAAIILAAGKASRFREADPGSATKVVASFKGEPLVRHVARAALAAGVSPVVVVTGCEAESVEHALAGLAVSFAHNRDFATGMASSIIAGVTALPVSVEAAFVMLGDMPLVSASLLSKLVQALSDNPDAAAIVPVYEGVRGNPVLLTRKTLDRAKHLQGDEGARRMLRDPVLKIVEVAADKSASLDVDTPDALHDIDRS